MAGQSGPSLAELAVEQATEKGTKYSKIIAQEAIAPLQARIAELENTPRESVKPLHARIAELESENAKLNETIKQQAESTTRDGEIMSEKMRKLKKTLKSLEKLQGQQNASNERMPKTKKRRAGDGDGDAGGTSKKVHRAERSKVGIKHEDEVEGIIHGQGVAGPAHLHVASHPNAAGPPLHLIHPHATSHSHAAGPPPPVRTQAAGPSYHADPSHPAGSPAGTTQKPKKLTTSTVYVVSACIIPNAQAGFDALDKQWSFKIHGVFCSLSTARNAALQYAYKHGFQGSIDWNMMQNGGLTYTPDRRMANSVILYDNRVTLAFPYNENGHTGSRLVVFCKDHKLRGPQRLLVSGSPVFLQLRQRTHRNNNGLPTFREGQVEDVWTTRTDIMNHCRQTMATYAKHSQHGGGSVKEWFDDEEITVQHCRVEQVKGGQEWKYTSLSAKAMMMLE